MRVATFESAYWLQDTLPLFTAFGATALGSELYPDADKDHRL